MMIKKTFSITAETGIHARPASQLVHCANPYQSDITLQYNERTVNLKSIMGVMSLGITAGAEVVISVNGADEEPAIEAISHLMIQEKIGDIKC